VHGSNRRDEETEAMILASIAIIGIALIIYGLKGITRPWVHIRYMSQDEIEIKEKE